MPWRFLSQWQFLQFSQLRFEWFGSSAIQAIQDKADMSICEVWGGGLKMFERDPSKISCYIYYTIIIYHISYCKSQVAISAQALSHSIRTWKFDITLTSFKYLQFIKPISEYFWNFLRLAIIGYHATASWCFSWDIMYWWICREVSGLNPSLGMLFEHVRTVLSSCKLDGQYHSVWYSMIMFFIVFPYSSMLFLSVFVALWHKASNSYSGACGKTSW